MKVYQSTKQKFLEDVFSNEIETIIQRSFIQNLHQNTSQSEIQSWKNSMSFMEQILHDLEIPNDAGVTIEHQVPQNSKLIDIILNELNQYPKVESVSKDKIITAFVRTNYYISANQINSHFFQI